MTQTTYTKSAPSTTTALRARHRSPVAIVCLCTITLGLYGIYLWYTFNRDLRDLGRSRQALGLGESPAVSTAAFMLGFCFVVPYVWTAVSTSRRIERATALVGVGERFRPAIPVVLLAAGRAAILAAGLATTWVWPALLLSLVLRASGLCVMQSALNRVWAACGIRARPPEPPPSRPQLESAAPRTPLGPAIAFPRSV